MNIDIKKVSAGAIIVTEKAKRYLIVTSKAENITKFRFIHIDNSVWDLAEPVFKSPDDLLNWFLSNPENPIRTIIPEDEVLPTVPWESKFSESEAGPFVIVLQTEGVIEFLTEQEDAYSDDISDARIFYKKEDIPTLRVDEFIRRAADFLPIRKVSIQGKGYWFNFETNATEAELKETMKDIITTIVGYSDDDIVPSLRKRGYYAELIKTPLANPDQVLSADW
ncbi:hypothetical protein [Paenibacillus sp. Y412MC10]|uniref:hypothetical protein n=1 Tax=Geobacillus sp. (strain Y412MC10) TaxID=481743 RepID=UPI0011AB4A51|nr:hypothetical protein [Paenibacillus sp. Y412MC10]